MQGDPQDIIRNKTIRWDTIRSVFHAFVETSWQTFALLIAIRVYDAPDSVKPLIPASYGIGLLFTWISTSWATRVKMQAAVAAALCYVACSIGFALAGCSGTLPLYILGVTFAMFCAAQIPPFITQIYALNYKASERGQRVATFIICGTVVGAMWAWLGGGLLDRDLDYWWAILLISSIFGAACAAVVLRIPSQRLIRTQGETIFSNFKLIRRDKLFAMALLGWWFIGMGNLMTEPLRVEYLANERYGINANNFQIGLMIGTIPFVSRLFATKIWGFLFDRLNLIVVRLILNAVFMLSIAIFFFTKNFWIMSLGCVFFGFAYGGGGIMWLLWVTKVSPPESVSKYMSVHTTLTGIRATMSPFLGYFLIVNTTPAWTALFALASIAISTLIFIPQRSAIEERTRLKNYP
ncbi:MAG: MFS transporter [Opitutales bacterium]|nr:MFS transporter [Opitutales bacterium]